MRLKILTCVVLTAACVSETQQATEPNAPTSAPPSTTLGPFPVDEAPRTRHVLVGTTREHTGITATIAVTSLAGTDSLSRPLPACIELPPGASSITVSAPSPRLAVWLKAEDESDFDDECAAAKRNALPPSIR